MPPVQRDNTDAAPRVPESPLKPFRFHKLEMSQSSSHQMLAECFICNRHKLYISSVNGLWDCKGCESGNPLQFIRKLYELSVRSTRKTDLEQLAASRKPLSADSLEAWGLCRSVIDRCWLVPGYNASGSIIQVYRYTMVFDGKKKRMALLPTPQMGLENEGHKHGYFMASGSWDSKKSKVYVAEGLWDAIAVWQSLRVTRQGWDGEPEKAVTESVSMLCEANIMGVPSATVFFPSWIKLLKDNKDVILLTQNDLPKVSPETGTVRQAGLDGTKRAAAKLIDHNINKSRISYLDWSGTSGLKDGYDCRDWMADAGEEPIYNRLCNLLKMVKPVPDDWFNGPSANAIILYGKGLKPIPCTTWNEVVASWKDALHWRDTLEYVLGVMMSVALSTDQAGDQLFLRVIGSPGSAKTRLADAMLTSQHCYPLEHLTGFHSGWKSGDDKDDYSLIARINHKTLITPEGDVIISSPHFHEIMSQQRRIFDGTTGSTFKTLSKDRRYTGLRTPWIICGTPALLNTDQAKLGDRFLTVFIDSPDENEKRSILERVGMSALMSVKQISGKGADSGLEERMAYAYRLTGGYVDYLRVNSQLLLSAVADSLLSNPGDILVDCAQLAEYTAWNRCQLPDDQNDEVTVELPTRLTHQFTRLACCLASVMNKSTVDDEVMTRVKQLSIDTSRGVTQRVAELLYLSNRLGFTDESLNMRINMDPKRIARQLRMMKSIGMVEYFRVTSPGSRSTPKWRLSQKAYDLFTDIKSKYNGDAQCLKFSGMA